ncbi:MAG: hypothetical protein M1840_002544 [Geoglossum simile]|nr:MAG: hypothetical protein M1840_002544 [Geoglossum simile]
MDSSNRLCVVVGEPTLLLDKAGAVSAGKPGVYSSSTSCSSLPKPAIYNKPTKSAVGLLRNVRKTARTAVQAPLGFFKAVPRWLLRPTRHTHKDETVEDKAQMLGGEEQEDYDTDNTESSSEDEMQWIAADWRNHQLHGYKAGLEKRKKEHKDQIAAMREVAAELKWIAADISSTIRSDIETTLKEREELHRLQLIGLGQRVEEAESTDEEDELLHLRVI